MIAQAPQTLCYEGEEKRIDSWLAEHFSRSRSFFHHILERGGVVVNGKTVKKSYTVKAGDSIDIDQIERFLSPKLLDDAPWVEIPILRETDDYLILHKPKWVLSHPTSMRNTTEPSVVAFLYHRFKNLPSIGNFIRAGLLHRLDKGTDGLMIIAKSERGLAHFKALFQEKSEIKDTEIDTESLWSRRLRKRYRTSCHVSPAGDVFLRNINNKLPFVLRELVVPKIPHSISKEGVTIIHEVSRWPDNLAHLIIEIITGRTHQIRYHMSKHGLPVVGDYLYGTDEGREMQLCAWKLEFIDLEGNHQVVEI